MSAACLFTYPRWHFFRWLYWVWLPNLIVKRWPPCCNNTINISFEERKNGMRECSIESQIYICCLFVFLPFSAFQIIIIQFQFQYLLSKHFLRRPQNINFPLHLHHGDTLFMFGIRKLGLEKKRVNKFEAGYINVRTVIFLLSCILFTFHSSASRLDRSHWDLSSLYAFSVVSSSFSSSSSNSRDDIWNSSRAALVSCKVISRFSAWFL